MRPVRIFAVAALALTVGSPASWAFDRPGMEHMPTENEKALKVAANQPQPYAMNYADEAAQSLGMKEGKWEAFQSRDSLMPSVRGGLDGGRPTLILRWQAQ